MVATPASESRTYFGHSSRGCLDHSMDHTSGFPSSIHFCANSTPAPLRFVRSGKGLINSRAFKHTLTVFTIRHINVRHPTVGIGTNRDFDVMVFVVHCPGLLPFPIIISLVAVKKSPILRHPTSMSHLKKVGCSRSGQKWSNFTKAIASRFQPT